jgi:hypothetical protein
MSLWTLSIRIRRQVFLTALYDLYASGRVIAHTVGRPLPTSAVRVRLCGICGGQSGTGAGFLRVVRFPLPILIPPTAPHSSSSTIRGSHSRPISGRPTNWTQSQGMAQWRALVNTVINFWFHKMLRNSCVTN